MPTSPIIIALLAFCVAGLLFAFVKGGPPERLGAAVILANLLLAFAMQMAPFSKDTLQGAQLLDDGLTALCLLILVLRFTSLWLGAVMILYAIQFSLHAFYLVTDRAPGDLLHAVVNNLTFSGVIWALIIGTAVSWRRRVMSARLAPKAAP
jgi:hypothetical protein